MQFLRFSVIVLALLQGCAPVRRPDGFPKVYRCKVDVRNGSAPLKDAEVSLVPADSQPYYAVYGTTDSSGTAVPVTASGVYAEKGVPVGEYVVTIRKSPRPEMGKTRAELNAMSSAEMDAYNAEYSRRLAALPPVVPEVLTNTDSSPLRLRVTEKGGAIRVDVGEYF